MLDDFPLRLSHHARMRLKQRGIPLDLVRRTLEHPDRTWPDPGDATITHASKHFHRLNDSILRVVYNHVEEPWLIVTAFFERKGRGLR